MLADLVADLVADLMARNSGHMEMAHYTMPEDSMALLVRGAYNR